MRFWAGVVVCGLAGLAGCSSGSGSGNSGGGSQQSGVKAPTANAGGPYLASPGSAISFSGAGSSDPQGQTLTYAWNFGDNTTGAGASPSHSYAVAGVYTVTLTVTDTSGLTGTATAKATVAAAPTANAGGPYSAAYGSTMTFNGGASTDPQGQTLTYAWNFGDGNTATGAITYHGYAAAGVYTVTLTVTDTSGLTGTSTTQATVLLPPVAKANGPYSVTLGTAINFSAAGSSDPQGQTLTYAWDFGDNTTGTGASVTHTYASAATYNVTLTVTDTSGLTGMAFVKAKAGLVDTPITGTVMSGTQPVNDAEIYLLAANTTGYGGAGIAASSSNASVSLLQAALTQTAPDSVGVYAFSDGYGAFSLSGDYTCAPGQQLYLYTTGGNTSFGTNGYTGMMAAIGPCPGPSDPPITVTVNEVSTVAAAYALAGFATDPAHISSSGTPLALTGIANAFANAANLATLSTGAALATTPAGNGTAPQAEINTLANILAACVETNGILPTGCSTLFANATADGTPAGAKPTDTATAAINIAHNPGTNVANLYALAGGTPPYAPGLTSVPNDWTVGIAISGGGLSAVRWIAIDGQGNAWVPDDNATASGQSGITEIASSGAFLSGANGYQGGGLNNPIGLAIDTNGDAWMTSLRPITGTVTSVNLIEVSSAGTFLSGADGYSLGAGSGDSVAADGLGNVWATNGTTAVEVSGSGNIVQTLNLPVPTGLAPNGFTIDASENLWLAGLDGRNAIVVEVTNSGTNLSGSGLTVSSLASTPQAVAISSSGSLWLVGPSSSNSGLTPVPLVDVSSGGGVVQKSIYGLDGTGGLTLDGNGDLWIPNASTNSVAEFSNAGVNVSNLPYKAGGVIQEPTDVAVDGSGNVWLSNFGNATVVEMIGAAVPVVTPISAGVKNNTLGTRP